MVTGKPLRLGVIGCGFFAQNHLNAWKEIEGVDLVAVCDIDPLKAQHAAASFAVPHCYTDAQEMLSNRGTCRKPWCGCHLPETDCLDYGGCRSDGRCMPSGAGTIHDSRELPLADTDEGAKEGNR